MAAGYHTFGVSEHVPRPSAYLYAREIELGWSEAKLAADFARYTTALPALVEQFADRLTVLRGFEAEVIPHESYIAEMRTLRNLALPDGSPAFDYFVGSVHHVEGIQIDGEPDTYQQAAEVCGGIEALAIGYYQTVAEMIETLRPDVTAHLDLIKRNLERAGYHRADIDTPGVQEAALTALAAARDRKSILDLNTAGWRKGLGEPYPSPWLVERATALGVPFCFGDDSHRPSEVGAGLEDARRYLLMNGVDSIVALTRESGVMVRRVCSLS